MTSFFCLLRRPHFATTAHQEIDLEHAAARGSSALSRGGHTIQRYRDDLFDLSCFENGAWGTPQTIFDDGTTVSWIAGNPLCPNKDGSIKPLSDSRQALHQSMAGQSEDTLRCTKGSFAAISWTRHTQRLVLCADKLALRPIYVVTKNTFVAASTSMHAMEVALSGLLSASRRGIGEKLFLGVHLGSSTIYSEIQRLQSAEVLTISPISTSSQFYFDWPTHLATLPLYEDPALDNLYEAFLNAIRRRILLQSEEAFLSGGLDSRCVVGGLLDLGVKVRTFGSSYEHSLDDVISSAMAARFGTDHVTYRKLPSQRILAEQDNFAEYARDHFPRSSSLNAVGRRLWSGDGGSVGLGHVYLDQERVTLAGSDLTESTLLSLFPTLRNYRSRMIQSDFVEQCRSQALQSCFDQFSKLSKAPSARRLYLFYLLNDQCRHLDNHYASIDQTDIELETPFFDSDFLTEITRYPIELCLRHSLYNQWLHSFRSPVGRVTWQSYPGHIPSSIALPPNAESQWSGRWYRDHSSRRILKEAVGQALAAHNPLLAQILHRPHAVIMSILTGLGVNRWQHELHNIIRLSSWLRSAKRFDD